MPDIDSSEKELNPEIFSLSCDPDTRSQEAEIILKKSMIEAAVMGLIPMPLLDVISLTSVQFKMIDNLSKLYNLKYTHIERAVVKSFLIGLLPTATITGLSSLFKFVPGVGTVVGSGSVSISSGALTYAIGRVFIDHFESGGTLENLNLETAKLQFDREVIQGKLISQEINKKN